MYLLCFLNEVHPLHKGKGWQASAFFDEFPTPEQILDHSCLQSSDENDVKMANLLVEKKGSAC